MLNDFTVEELEEEIKRRRNRENLIRNIIVREDKEQIKEDLYNNLVEGVERDIDSKIEKGYYTKDTEVYTWETVIQAFYGKDVFLDLNRI